MTTAYFFEIAENKADGWPHYNQVLAKDVGAAIEAEIDALVSGTIKGWGSASQSVTTKPTGLDIEFTKRGEAYLIFKITNPEDPPSDSTHFDKSEPLHNLKVKGLGNARVIRQAKTYADPEGKLLWAVAKIDLQETCKEIRKEHEPHDHSLTQFPFVFNFVEKQSGISTFVAAGHGHDHGLHPKAINVHGGIHPRDPANCICTPGDGG